MDKFKSHNSNDNLLSQLKWKKVYVVEKDREIAATGAFANFGIPENPKYSVSNLYVKPELHCEGIRSTIFAQRLSDARKSGALTLHVPSSKNAIGFYAKMGFTADSQQPDLADEITRMTMNL